MSRNRNWSRQLPRPLKIPDVMTLQTLADVRSLIGHLPADRRRFDTWQAVERRLNKAALGGNIEDVAIALRMVLMLERVSFE